MTQDDEKDRSPAEGGESKAGRTMEEAAGETATESEQESEGETPDLGPAQAGP